MDIISVILSHILGSNSAKQYLYMSVSNPYTYVISLVKQVIDDNDLILDIGAYTGEKGDSTQLFGRAFPNNMIFGFEPLNSIFNLLKENTKKMANIIPINYALSDYIGESEFTITKSVASSSLLTINEDVTNCFWKDKVTLNGTSKVNVTTLDDYFSTYSNLSIALLKIKVQGSELNTLLGGINTIKHVKIIIIQMYNHNGYNNCAQYYEVDAFLRNNGFILYRQFFSDSSYSIKQSEWHSIYINTNFCNFK